MASRRTALACVALVASAAPSTSFVVVPVSNHGPAHAAAVSSSSVLMMGYNRYGDGRSSSRYAQRGNDRSKRQERVGHLVRTELAQIIHRGYPVKYADPLDDDLLKRINIVNADVSPDLRNARITISVTGTGSQDTVDKRRAFSWLVQNSKMIKHAMAQRLSHMKSVPELTFVQVDVGAAVDVMHLIDKVNTGYKRESVGAFGENDDTLPMGYTLDDEDDWEDEDGDDWEDFDDDDEEDDDEEE